MNIMATWKRKKAEATEAVGPTPPTEASEPVALKVGPPAAAKPYPPPAAGVTAWVVQARVLAAEEGGWKGVVPFVLHGVNAGAVEAFAKSLLGALARPGDDIHVDVQPKE